MRTILSLVVLLVVCVNLHAEIVDLSPYFPQTLMPKCWREEAWGGGYEDDYQTEIYSTYINGLESGVEYNFLLSFLPEGEDIDNISNFFYEVTVGVNYSEDNIGYGDNETFYIGVDWQVGEWSSWEYTRTFSNLDYCQLFIISKFYRTAPEPWSGEWQTTLNIDSPAVPEPSLLMVLPLLLMMKRK